MPDKTPFNATEWLTGLAGRDGAICRADALRILALGPEHCEALLASAEALCRAHSGNRVKTCSIINAKSGRCSEDCAFCAQSARYTTSIPGYPIMGPAEMLERAAREEAHSLRCSIVTAGRSITAAELETVCEAIAGFRMQGLHQKPCASLGILGSDDFKKLKAAGLKRFHHNLEASRTYFPRVCTTHSYEDRMATIHKAKQSGLELCVGAIFGLGENDGDRVAVLEEIRALDPDSVPLNFLVPIKGTPLAGHAKLPVWEAIKIIALARHMMPRKDILIGGGRLEVFGDKQYLIFKAGANAMIVGDLLTVKGLGPEADMALLKELGLKLA